MNFRPYSFPLTRPLVTALGTVEARQGFVVCIASDGFKGFGESAPMPPFSVETLAQCEADLKRGMRVIRAAGPADALTALPEDLCSSARCGLEVALLDWMARQADAPLSFLLGGEGLDLLPVTALVRDAEGAQAAVDRGHRLLKVKVGTRSLSAEIAFLEDLLGSLNADVLLRLDANGAFDLPQAEAFFRAISHLPVESVEDPLCLEQVGELKALHRFQIGLGVDEALRHPAVLQGLFEAQSADYLVLKPMWSGGFLQSHALGMAAAERGMGIALSTALGGSIDRAACIQLAAALPSEALWPAGVDTGDWLSEDHCDLPMPIQDGHLSLSLLAGLGLEMS
jgi:o-succinylbenzoate synthase